MDTIAKPPRPGYIQFLLVTTALNSVAMGKHLMTKYGVVGRADQLVTPEPEPEAPKEEKKPGIFVPNKVLYLPNRQGGKTVKLVGLDMGRE